jgi:protein-disulfide isomerase
MEINAPIEDDQGRDDSRVWWLLGGAGILGVCCLAACALLALAITWLPQAQPVFSRFNPFGGTPMPGLPGLAPDVSVLTPQPFAYPHAQDNSTGDPNAPLKVVEFGDFQCPFCTRFWDESEKSFIRDYVATGKVYFTYRALSFLGPESKRAAEAAYCAGEQNKFWEYHDVLFANQGAENSSTFSDANLAAFARSAGLDQARFVDCLSSGTYAARVEQDAADAKQAGIDSSPSFLINGALLVGASPYDEFAHIIENVLKGNYEDFPAPPGQNGF